MITLDFETRSVVDLIKLGATRYATDASTQALCLSWAFDQEEEVHLWHRDHPWIEKSPRPDELLERIASGELVEAHNARFEWLIWRYCLMREFSEFDVPIELDQLRCSAAKASCVSLPRSLGDAVLAVKLEERKDPDGQRLINKLCKPMRKVRRKIDGKLAHKTLLRYELLDQLVPGNILLTATAQLLADDIASSHPVPPAAAHASARNTVQRLEQEGYLESRSRGVFAWTGKLPTPEEHPPREDRENIAYEQATTNPGNELQWCEDEIEHRRNWVYNQQDVRAERGLSNFCPEMTERELEYWRMDFRMNDRGITLDQRAAGEAVKLCEQEVLRLNTEMQTLTGGAVLGGSKRIPFRKWANGVLAEVGGGSIPDTKADTLSFALYGAPTKAGDEAKASAKEATDAKWASWGPVAEPLRRAMEICLEVNRSSVAKYRQMMGSVCEDGRLHDIMLYNGADRTGRWSGKGVQPHNFVRGYQADMGMATLVDKDHPEYGYKPPIWDDILTLDLDYITLCCGDPLPVMAKACRGALTASAGKELYAADFNAIEARKLAWMAGCSSLLNLFRTGGDPYCAMATAIYKREITKKDKSERQMGKKAVLGLGYAMGWEKFQSTVWMEEGIWLDDEFCQGVVKIYRKDMYPEIPALWKAVERAAIAAVVEGGEHYAGGDQLGNGAISYFMSEDRNFLHCRLPSGRLLAYLYPEVHTKITYRFNAINERGKPCVVSFPAKIGVAMQRVKYHADKLAQKQRKTLTGDPPESFQSPHLSFMGRNTFTHQWQRNGTHGGSLVENADQASSRDLLAEAMYRIDAEPDFDLLLSIHDEVIAEAPIGTATLSEFESMMAEVPFWAPGMPIAAEGWIGPRLRK